MPWIIFFTSCFSSMKRLKWPGGSLYLQFKQTTVQNANLWKADMREKKKKTHSSTETCSLLYQYILAQVKKHEIRTFPIYQCCNFNE